MSPLSCLVEGIKKDYFFVFGDNNFSYKPTHVIEREPTPRRELMHRKPFHTLLQTHGRLVCTRFTEGEEGSSHSD